ncbi:Positive regulator of Tartrate dehydrogenase/decarboxylase/D-malic enzyme [Rubrivivax sp. A210]|uniref:LysR substrate-binding domain-containing protein n=1 Tax=Rubrivivax sp. A210 TaxID=2772301 RepID=UPI001918AB1A|nr:LysR substrate-binding domain-containing protein [Rubrivivax sp. A210]CAD5372733.1 Positive regulator of Tartrate dehydrogenase/decarboxylase/D-malic enzyme [Rubrivivax sp. A210]
MTAGIQAADLAFFSALAGAGSLSAAARELGISTPAVSKHLALMEARLGLALVNRTTRRMSLTPEGELYLEHARRILGEIDDMQQLLGVSKATPQGLLRVNATLGFGRSHVAPLISRFVRQHPQVEVQLQLSVNPPPLSDDAFDVCIRFGAPPDARIIARYIAPNRRLLCAAPAYLARHGTPKAPSDLVRHNCIGIRQGEEAYGVWRLASGLGGGRGKAANSETVKVRGNLTTNDGEIAVKWALDGHGILMRAEWDIARHLHAGRLVQVLPQYCTPDADIHAVYPQRHQLAARVRAFVDFLALSLAQQASGGRG